jgi:hypothetical protein
LMDILDGLGHSKYQESLMCFPDQIHLCLLLKTMEIVKYKRRPFLMAYPLLEDVLETASLVIDYFDV